MSSRRHKRARWTLYILLLLLRFFGVFQRGYIHPDEFFQGGSELFFGRYRPHDDQADGDENGYIVKNVPWEFEPVHAVRSIVPPAFMTLLPLHLYATVRPWLGRFISCPYLEADFAETKRQGEEIDVTLQKSFLESSGSFSGKEILLVPRLFMALLSVIFLDGSLWMLLYLSRRMPRQPNTKRGETSTALTLTSMASFGLPIEVIILASSWPCLVFGVRPFTNSLEAMVLAFLLMVVVMNVSNSMGVYKTNHCRGVMNGDALSLLLIGAICSVGIFVRFTFAFFAFPIVVIFLWHRWKRMDFKLKYLIYDGLWMALSFLLISGAFIWVDTQYYSWQEKLTCDLCAERYETKLGSILKYIAPFNAFRYNSKSTNLAEHGLHPRITHAAVNMPMLFGPSALIWYGSIIKNMHVTIIGRRRKHHVDPNYSFTETACQWTILSGLLVLSCAPHQEPRFILPSIVPLMFLYGRKVVGGGEGESGTDSVATHPKQSKVALSLLAFWITFNLILYMFFGWLHQGGLIPSLLHLPGLGSVLSRNESATQSPRAFIYYKTYMPPSFLTRGRTYTARKESICEASEGDYVEETCLDDLQHQTEVILDLQGANSWVLLELLRNLLPCHSPDIDDGDTAAGKLSDSADDRFLYLVSPSAVILPLIEEHNESSATMKWAEYSIISHHSHNGHISTEDWPPFDGSVKKFLGQLKLDLYSVSCVQ